METVFDYYITLEECKAYLFQLRGDKSAVGNHLSKLPPEMVNDFQRMITHP